MNRIFEVRGVWYTGTNRVESYPCAELEQRCVDFGRRPNAIGIYERCQDGTLMHVTDESDTAAAERFLEQFMATLSIVRKAI